MIVEDCLVEETKDGKVIYQHQMLAASIVHPTQKIVLPLCPEPIKKQDGSNKNDCERNAGKRFLKKFHEDYPKLKVVFVEDALSANAPRVENLMKANVRIILGAKPGPNKYRFEQVLSYSKRHLRRHARADSYGKTCACFLIAVNSPVGRNSLQLSRFLSAGRSSRSIRRELCVWCLECIRVDFFVWGSPVFGGVLERIL